MYFMSQHAKKGALDSQQVIKFTSCLPMVGGSLRVLVSSTTKTGRHDIAEIFLKVALNTENQSINHPSTRLPSPPRSQCISNLFFFLTNTMMTVKLNFVCVFNCLVHVVLWSESWQVVVLWCIILVYLLRKIIWTVLVNNVQWYTQKNLKVYTLHYNQLLNRTWTWWMEMYM